MEPYALDTSAVFSRRKKNKGVRDDEKVVQYAVSHTPLKLRHRELNELVNTRAAESERLARKGKGSTFCLFE